MLADYCIEAIARTMQDLIRSPRPFGRTFVLFYRVFQQVLPVIKIGSGAQIVQACVRPSHLYFSFRPWRHTHTLQSTALLYDINADDQALSVRSLLELG